MKEGETPVPEWVGTGGVIRQARERAGLSARQLSRMSGLSESYVTKVEAGMEPSLVAFARIAMQLHLNPHEVWVCVVQESLR